MNGRRGISANGIAIAGIVLTTVAVLLFHAYSTQANRAALAELGDNQRLSDQYTELQVRILAAEAAFYEAVLVPSEATRQNLDDSISAAFAQSIMIAGIDPVGAARQADAYTRFSPLLETLRATSTAEDLENVYESMKGSDSISALVLDVSANAAEVKAEADSMTAEFERSQRVNFWLSTGVSIVGLGLVCWLAVVIRRSTRRESSLAEKNQQLESSNARAERANREKTEFLSRMSHELRTPMNAVLGFGQLLQLDELTNEQRENVDYIMSSGRHLLRLIDEVLDISRIEAGKFGLSLEVFAPDSVIHEVVDMMRPLAAESNIALVVRPTAEGALAVGDTQRAKQVLLNLVSNAVKYNRPGGKVTIEVIVSADGRLQVSVADTGPGIPADKLKRLFSPFDRLDAEASSIEGTGLGLALSRVLVEAMNGTLTVDSIEGRGSTFAMHLPAALASIAPSPQEPIAELTGEPFSVLYIEDNLSNFGLVERSLRQRGDVRLLAARTGREGIALARESRPSLVLLDYHLPDMTGLDVLEVLKMDPETRKLPIVLISASTSARMAEQAMQCGAAATLTKPLDLPELFSTITRVTSSSWPVAA